MQETQETQVRSLGQEDPLKEEMATHSSIAAWEIPWKGAWRATVHRVAELNTTEHSTHNNGCLGQFQLLAADSP